MWNLIVPIVIGVGIGLGITSAFTDMIRAIRRHLK